MTDTFQENPAGAGETSPEPSASGSMNRVTVCRGSALWHGPPQPGKPTCKDGHREVVMSLRKRPDLHWKCRKCGRILEDQDFIESWKQGTEYRQYQMQADQELAIESVMNWDARYPWMYKLILDERPEIRDIQTVNMQKNERWDELKHEAYVQWSWAWSAPRPKNPG